MVSYSAVSCAIDPHCSCSVSIVSWADSSAQACCVFVGGGGEDYEAADLGTIDIGDLASESRFGVVVVGGL